MFGWFEENDELIIILELLDPFRSLRSFISDHKDGLDETLAREIMRQTVTASKYSIAHGFSHCSLKPSNVLIHTETKQIKLLGFTCSKLISAHKKADSIYCGE